jgi:predicted nucleic acid-binding protein
MHDRVFIDTNVLLYVYSEDEPEKQKVAEELLLSYGDRAIISTQVINEFTNILFKKYKMSAVEVSNAVAEVDTFFPIISFSIATQKNAIKIKEKYQFQYYDSLIIATALEKNCTTLFSEDMQNGQLIEKRLKIVNPFVTRHI